MIKKTLFFGTLAVMAAWVHAQPYATWNRFRTLTVNTTSASGGANVSVPINNFPLLVRLTAAGGAATGANVLTEALTGGADVRFTDSTGNTALAYQIDSWNTSSATIWVKVPVVAGNAQTKVRMYWGKAGETSLSSGGTVFDTANGHTAIWHLNEDGGGTANVLDATANGLNFNGHASVTAVPGMIGNARNYNNSSEPSNFWVDDFSGAGNTVKATKFQAAGLATRLTISAWVNPQANSGQDIQGIFGHYRYGSNNRSYMLSMSGTTPGAIRINASANGTADQVITTTTTPLANLNTWHHVMFTIDTTAAANTQFKVYVDGVRQPLGNRTTGTVFIASVANDVDRPMIGAMETSYNHRFVGFIDELQFANGAVRDSNWAKLSFATQQATVTAVVMGATTPVVARALFYPLKNAVYLRNAVVENNVPVAGGAASAFTITPSTMPTGLTFNSSNGTIAGTPSALQAATQYIVNATVGGSPASDTITIAVTAGNPPNPPTNIEATRGNKQVVVSWAAPLVVGSAAISSYKVTASPDSSKNCVTANGTTLTCTVTGLTNGVSYSFAVKAISPAGTSVASSPSGIVIPAGVPSAPTGVTVANTGGSAPAITVNWTIPVSDSGSALTEYYGTGTPTGSCYAAAPATTCTATNVTFGTSYTFTVTAVNGVGSSAISAPSATLIATGIQPGSLVIRVSGSAKPFTFLLPEDALTSTDKVTMSINDIHGRTVWSKSVRPREQLNVKEITWNGKASNGSTVSAGMYVVKIQTVSGGKAVDFTQKALSIKPL